MTSTLVRADFLFFKQEAKACRLPLSLTLQGGISQRDARKRESLRGRDWTR